MKQPEEPRCRR